MMQPADIALQVVNHIPAMLAYWDANQRCVFSNDAYRIWFGRSPDNMLGLTMREVLGPKLYEMNLPHILAALRGAKQVFERQIPLPDGTTRESIANYIPDIVDGVVQGFFVHVADVTVLRQREAALERVIRERDAALAELMTLRGLLPICASCKSIRDGQGNWYPIEEYVSQRADVQFSHGLCPKCARRLFPEFTEDSDQWGKPKSE